MLTIDDIKEKLSSHSEQLATFRVASLHVFGSIARSEGTADSDIDVLVDFLGPADFLSFTNLKLYLENLLGVKVDLVTRKALRPALKPDIEHEAVRVA